MSDQFFECFDCGQVAPLESDGSTMACFASGSTNGVTRTDETIKQLLDHGAYYSIDPRTGHTAKKQAR